MIATQRLHEMGQSLWLDNMTRGLLASGADLSSGERLLHCTEFCGPERWRDEHVHDLGPSCSAVVGLIWFVCLIGRTGNTHLP
jgi:hypothetical protein